MEKEMKKEFTVFLDNLDDEMILKEEEFLDNFFKMLHSFLKNGKEIRRRRGEQFLNQMREWREKQLKK